jgi:hypothetical protein
MKKLIMSHVKIAILMVGLATLYPPLTDAFADSTNDSFTPSLVSQSAQEDTSLLNRRLLAAKKDLEQYLVFAEYFNNNGDTKTAEQLKGPLDDFIKKHVDNLLVKSSEQVNLETTRLSAEIMFTKSRLLLNLNQGEAAQSMVAEMKKRFGPYQNNTVNISGRSTTLSEAIRQLDEEMAKTARTTKK